MAEWEMTDLTEGWEPSVFEATALDGRPIAILSATRAMTSTDPRVLEVIDETHLWMPRVSG